MIKRLRPGTVVLFNHGTEPPDGALTIETCQAAWPTDVLNTERHPCKPGQFTPEQTWRAPSGRLRGTMVCNQTEMARDHGR